MNCDLFDTQNEDKFENKKDPVTGKKRLRYADRHQVKFTKISLDELISKTHRARNVWEYVSKLDVSDFQKDIRVKENAGGPPTIDPRVLLALWLYATLEGIASARHINRLCQEHYAYIWICGGLSINYHTLSDFRTRNSGLFRNLLVESIALMWKSGVFDPEEVAQDGTRVKANAGFNTYRTEKTLSHYLEKAHECVEKLEQELLSNPSISSQQASAKKRALRERNENIETAKNELEKYKEERKISCKKNHDTFTQEDKDKMRASITDPECRKMKMGDGGFRLAYNVQFATSVKKK